ncbi:hypothetical protein M3Y94_00254900 [Aphelenchoides besseyi]|nr:hypothetical protein M3Y94_00254900 [Aphelenchoides besseyi]KAI6236225.1 hypothetical protein M3Y95_00135000 [Aphelenchoides besseyi]
MTSDADESKTKQIIQSSWTALLAKCMFENGVNPTKILDRNTSLASQFATDCLNRIVDKSKIVIEKSAQLPNKQANDLKPARSTTTSLTSVSSRHWPSIDRLHKMRPIVVFVAGGWKAQVSEHITFIQIQGLSVVDMIDQVDFNESDWSRMKIMLVLCDLSWSLVGHFSTFEKLLGKLAQKAMNAKMCICKIPSICNEGAWPEKLFRINNFNYKLQTMQRCSYQPTIEVWEIDSIVEEINGQLLRLEPQYLKPKHAKLVVAKLVERLEAMATKMKLISQVKESTDNREQAL